MEKHTQTCTEFEVPHTQVNVAKALINTKDPRYPRTVAQAARILKISESTVRRNVGILVSEGYIRTITSPYPKLFAPGQNFRKICPHMGDAEAPPLYVECSSLTEEAESSGNTFDDLLASMEASKKALEELRELLKNLSEKQKDLQIILDKTKEASA